MSRSGTWRTSSRASSSGSTYNRVVTEAATPLPGSPEAVAEYMAAMGIAVEPDPGTKPVKVKGKKKKPRKPPEMRLLLAQLRVHLALGHTDDQIAEEMSLRIDVLKALKREFYRHETIALHSATAEEVFIDYAVRQKQCITDLSDLIPELRAVKQHAAIIGAIKAKSDILDKVIKTGQEMGILEKAPERKMVFHGVAIANLDNTKLRRVIAGELQGLAAIVDKFGDKDLFGKPMGEDRTVIPALPSATMPAPPEFSDKGEPARAGTSAVRAEAARKRMGVMRKKATTAPPESG